MEEVTRVNSRLTQENSRLQREAKDVRRQERALQGNLRQLTQENARLTQLQLQQNSVLVLNRSHLRVWMRKLPLQRGDNLAVTSSVWSRKIRNSVSISKTWFGLVCDFY